MPNRQKEGNHKRPSEILQKNRTQNGKLSVEAIFPNSSFNRKANIKHIPSVLSERYKYTIQYHLVVPALESFISNAQNRFREVVLNSTLPEKTKRVLL
ncbi:MAG: RNA-guided endonuclease TnpB family protein, partial [Endomicrobiia bacterium]